MSLSFVVYVLVAHFVADFVCQSDWMAIHKSKRWDALALHVLVYTGVGLVPFMLSDHAAPSVWLWIVVNASAHFAQDAATSRITSRLWFFARADGIWEQASFTAPQHGRRLVNPFVPIDGRRHWFFVAIGADQLLHYVTLFVTAEIWIF